MARKKVALAQLEIPVPPSPEARGGMTEAERAQAYADEKGPEAAERNRRYCTCKAADDKAPRYKHRPGCRMLA